MADQEPIDILRRRLARNQRAIELTLVVLSALTVPLAIIVVIQAVSIFHNAWSN